ncbi:MAG: hypothetical protein JWN76_684 [Chitinophagaceae bacterium]|nr:hypothetical protein [Chitinophagaceae bacterium]
MNNNIPITAHAILQELLDGIMKLDHAFITGMYVTGSLALNDFHPGKSAVSDEIIWGIIIKHIPTLKIEVEAFLK